MNFSIESTPGLFGALVIVSMVILGLLLAAGLFRTVTSRRKSLQDIETDQNDREAVPIDAPANRDPARNDPDTIS